MQERTLEYEVHLLQKLIQAATTSRICLFDPRAWESYLLIKRVLCDVLSCLVPLAGGFTVTTPFSLISQTPWSVIS